MRLLLFLAVLGLNVTIPDYEASLIDSTANPAVDFYQYANGNWMQINTLPRNIPRYNQLSELDSNMLLGLSAEFTAIMHEADREPASGDSSDKIAAVLQAYYRAGVFDDANNIREKRVLAKQIQAIQSRMDRLPELIADLHLLGVGPLFRVYDPYEWQVPDYHRLYLRQPKVNIMTGDDEAATQFNANYRDYLGKLFAQAGYTEIEAKAQADAAIRVESEIAGILQPDPRSPWDMFNKRSTEKFVSYLKPMDFNIWLRKLAVNEEEAVVVDHPQYFRDLSVLLQHIDTNDLASFLTSRFLTVYSRYLHGGFRTARAGYYRAQYGLDLLDDAGKPIVEQMTYDLPEYLNEFYLDRFVTKEIRAGIESIAENVRTAWIHRVEQNDWMKASERKRALQKLASMELVIGGESIVDSVASLSLTDEIIGADSEITFIEIAMKIRNWRTRNIISRIGRPWNHSRPGFWSFSLDFHYSPTENKIEMGGANLQAPNFVLSGNPSANYGGIGSRIGHEMTHAIDAQGRRYNVDGKPLNWFQRWGLTSQFDKRCDTLVEQYDDYYVADDCHVNGEATLMENLADLGGVLAAYDALILACSRQQGSCEPDARVYLLAYAQKWRELITDEQERIQCQGPHAPSRYRAIGPLQNIDVFYETFDIQPGNPMYLEPERRTSIW